MATKPRPKSQYCRSCGHTEPHHRVAIWLLGFHYRPIRRYVFCANNDELPQMWRERADPSVLPGVRRSLMLVRSTNGYCGAALMPYYGYKHPPIAEPIAEILESALFPD